VLAAPNRERIALVQVDRGRYAPGTMRLPSWRVEDY
jgi:hypothetical protein